MLLPQTKKNFPLPPLAPLRPLLSPSLLSLPLVRAGIGGFPSQPLPRAVRSISCLGLVVVVVVERHKPCNELRHQLRLCSVHERWACIGHTLPLHLSKDSDKLGTHTCSSGTCVVQQGYHIVHGFACHRKHIS